MLNSEAAAQLWSLSVSQPLLAGHLFGLRKHSGTPSSWWVQWLALGLLKLPVAGWVWKRDEAIICKGVLVQTVVSPPWERGI